MSFFLEATKKYEATRKTFRCTYELNVLCMFSLSYVSECCAVCERGLVCVFFFSRLKEDFSLFIGVDVLCVFSSVVCQRVSRGCERGLVCVLFFVIFRFVFCL